jgi:hypothetical protein
VRPWRRGGIGACSTAGLSGAPWRNEGLVLHYANISAPAAVMRAAYANAGLAAAGPAGRLPYGNFSAFPITASSTSTSSPTISPTTSTLSEIIYANENNDVASKHRFAYSQALAFKVQLQDMATRAQWQLRPALAILTAFTDGGSSPSVGTEPDIASTYTAFGASTRLDVDFCGLNRNDLVAAFAFADGANAGAVDGLSSPIISGGVITDLGRWGNMEEGLTTGLNSRLAQLIQANAFNSVDVFQGNIFSTAAGGSTGPQR